MHRHRGTSPRSGAGPCRRRVCTGVPHKVLPSLLPWVLPHLLKENLPESKRTGTFQISPEEAGWMESQCSLVRVPVGSPSSQEHRERVGHGWRAWALSQPPQLSSQHSTGQVPQAREVLRAARAPVQTAQQHDMAAPGQPTMAPELSSCSPLVKIAEPDQPES